MKAIVLLVFLGMITVSFLAFSVVPDVHPLAPGDVGFNRTVESELATTTRENLANLISRNHYLQPNYEDVYSQVNTQKSVQEYLQSLDLYSRLATSAEISFFRERGRLARTGVGADFLFDGTEVLLVPVYGAGLYNSGVRTAAILESINNKHLDIADFTSYEFLGEIQVNESVNLVLRTPPNSKTRLFNVEATSYANNPVRFYQNKSYVVLEVRQFRSGYTSLVREAIVAAQKSKLFVIDLRYSPGGDIYAMTDWLSLLLPEKQLVSTLQTKRYDEPIELRTLSGQLDLHIPIVILISHYTASSAEIFAQVLNSRLNEQVTLLGDATKGKCLAQKTYTVNDEFSLVLSTHEVIAVQGSSCRGKKLQAEIQIDDVEFKTLDQIVTGVP